MTNNSDAVQELEERGAYLATQEDRIGDTCSGWWMDDVWLALENEPVAALNALDGN